MFKCQVRFVVLGSCYSYGRLISPFIAKRKTGTNRYVAERELVFERTIGE